jgi:phage baseplate assembly protein W
MADIFKTDLRIVFQDTGHGPVVELAIGAKGPTAVSGVDNLVQALTLRLLVDQGELEALGHPRYGSRIRELLGARLDRANLELVRRIVRQTLLDDPRVAEVIRVFVQPRFDAPGIVDVEVEVRSISGEAAQIGVSFDAA